ncbi:MAG: SH3 domain-containing protein [Pseudomonadota bacterium]
MLSGCASLQPETGVEEAAPAPEPDPVFTQKLTDAEAKVAELEQQVAEQAFELRQLREELAASEVRQLAATAQLTRVQVQAEEARLAADDAIAEVVRTQAKLQGSVSQADAASNIAEAEIALGTLASNDPASEAKIRNLLAEASNAFDSRNYGGALYLSNQAKRGIAALQEAASATSPGENAEAFADPIAMWVTRKSNMREGPGLEFDVITVLERDTAVEAYAYSGAWVRVRLESGEDGWVFQPLLSQTDPLPPESP